jgi:hypothetical protein
MTQPVLFAVEDGEHSLVTVGATVQHPQNTDALNHVAKAAERRKRSQIAEVLFLKKAIEIGYAVKWMQGDCKNYDIILERPSMRPMFVQVKSAGTQAGRSDYVIRNSSENVVYDAVAYDVLAVHLYDRNEWVLYTRSELGNRTATSYLPAEFRQYAARSRACDARTPDNWSLLDDVAESLTLSGPTPADV